MSTVFMICGNTGAGKSTYSYKLAEQENAIQFSIDPWLYTLYGADYDPQIHDFAWLVERTERCRIQMQGFAELLIKQNLNIILDFGFGDIELRKFYRKWAVSLGANVSLHFLDISTEERRKRVHKRNKEQGQTFTFEVTDEMFDYCEPMFIPPSEDELKNGLIIK